MKKYYISDGNKKFGPLSKNDILSALTDGRILLTDYIFDAATNEWVSVLQHPDFTSSNNDRGTKTSSKSQLYGLVSEGLSGGDASPNRPPASLLSKETSVAIDTSDNTTKSEVTSIEPEDESAPIEWYTKKEEQIAGPFSYLSIISLLQDGQLKEFDYVKTNNSNDWKKVSETPNFKPEALKVFRSAEGVEKIRSIYFRRSHERIRYGRNILIFNRHKLYRVFCLELSQSGAGIASRKPHFQINDAVYIRFNTENITDTRFDVKALVVSQRLVQIEQSPNPLFRYGLSFEKIGQNGRKHLEKFVGTFDKE